MMDLVVSLLERQDVGPLQIIYFPADTLTLRDLRRYFAVGRSLTSAVAGRGRVWLVDEVTAVSGWTSVAAAVAWYTEFLGVETYFMRSGPDGRPAYAEFRIGDYQAELGIIDRNYGPPGAATEPGGAVMHWHVDDLNATVERLLSMGAKVYQPITPRGEAGFVTAAVVDPFGNVLGVMHNPHYLEVLESTKSA